MKALIPLAEGFEETEAITTADILRRAGFEVVLAGLPSSIMKGAHGIHVITDAKLEVINPDDFDVLVLPGGSPGCENLSKSGKITEIIKDFDRKKKDIAAICAAPSILADLGVLDDKRATIYPGMEREIPRPRDGKVIVDGHVITSQGPGTAVDFSLAIVEKKMGSGKANKLRQEIVVQ
jgi:4-methyl-5(b-hydroxyethyl)-thiazole monophosphate biosynthesis